MPTRRHFRIDKTNEQLLDEISIIVVKEIIEQSLNIKGILYLPPNTHENVCGGTKLNFGQNVRNFSLFTKTNTFSCIDYVGILEGNHPAAVEFGHIFEPCYISGPNKDIDSVQAFKLISRYLKLGYYGQITFQMLDSDVKSSVDLYINPAEKVLNVTIKFRQEVCDPRLVSIDFTPISFFEETK